ncbi:MAG: low molecular weight protein arginine phosphatase [Alicyclobacillus sp.]|nr:low molecular weight protein arginine phosphatase [Alicyclobacillus sp.]
MQLLFVCTGNTCRSPMAAAIANDIIQTRGLPWRAVSAGLFASAGEPMSAGAAQALTRRQIPLAPHRSQPISPELVAASDRILCMTEGHAAEVRRRFPEAADKVEVLGAYRVGNGIGSAGASPFGCDIVDPFGGTDEAYETAAAQIEAAVRALLDRLEGLQSESGHRE